MKITKEFVRSSVEKDIHHYLEATNKIGLWKSERYIFDKYLTIDDFILDIGCGAGRTTFAIFDIGYTNIIGLDLSPSMIETSKKLAECQGKDLDFVVGDATDLKYKSNTFSKILFSFNGFMQIPTTTLRLKALKEIRRVLKKGGHFIFTTHDRSFDTEYFEFWREQEVVWRKGLQDKRLQEFGDVITVPDRNTQREVFIHIPTKDEVLELLDKSNLQLVETFFRSDLFTESDEVKDFSGECRFFVVEK